MRKENQGEADRFRQLYCMEVMENVLDGEGYEAWRRLHHVRDP